MNHYLMKACLFKFLYIIVREEKEAEALGV